MNKDPKKATNAQGAEVAIVGNLPAKSKSEAIVKNLPSQSVEQLLKENQELKNKLLVLPKTLDEKIEYFEKKKKVINQLSKIEATQTQLFEALSEIEELKGEDDFLNENYQLRLTYKKGYSAESDLFKLNNPTIISELVQFVCDRIEVKRGQLKAEIEQ